MCLPFHRLRHDNFQVLIIGLLLCIGFGSLIPTAVGQGVSATPAGTSDVHIGVVERREAVKLSNRNISASVAGKSVGVAISRGAAQVPTHMLVILEQGPQNAAAYQRTIESLNRVFGRGWLVSAVRPDGYETPYAGSEAALSGALNSGAPTSFDYDKAFNELASFAGRRVLIVEQSVSATNLPMLAEARRLIPEIYRVDGGMVATLADLAFDGSFNLPIPTSDAANIAEDVPATPAASVPPPAHIKRRTANGVMHELKFEAAVKDALGDAAYYYDLDLKVPVPGLGGPLLLTYRHLPRSTVLLSETPYVSAANTIDGVTRAPVQESVLVRRQ